MEDRSVDGMTMREPDDLERLRGDDPSGEGSDSGGSVLGGPSADADVEAIDEKVLPTDVTSDEVTDEVEPGSVGDPP
jgi:hypothetical protein